MHRDTGNGKRLHVEHVQRVLKFALSCRWIQR